MSRTSTATIHNRGFLGLAIPSIAASLLVPISGLVDTAMLGHLETIAPLAGVALGGVLFDYLYWSFGFLRMGTTGIAARAFGREDHAETRAILLRSCLLGLLAGTLILLLQWPILTATMEMFSGEPKVKLAAREYFNARVWGAPAVLINFSLMGWLLGVQRTRDILILSAIGNGTNIALDYLWIHHLAWGARGAGLATMASQWTMLAIAVPLVRRRWVDNFGDAATNKVFSIPHLLPMLRLGRDIGLRTLALITTFALFANFSAAFSSTILAANTVLLRVLGLASYFIDGFAHATESLTGALHGRRDGPGLRHLLKTALLWGTGTGAIFAATFVTFPQLFTLLTSHPALIAAVMDARLWLVIVLMLGSVAYILDGYFIGLTAGKTLAKAMLLSFSIGFLPLALWARYFDGGPQFLWLALIAFMTARVVTLGIEVPRSLRNGSEPSQNLQPPSAE